MISLYCKCRGTVFILIRDCFLIPTALQWSILGLNQVVILDEYYMNMNCSPDPEQVVLNIVIVLKILYQFCSGEFFDCMYNTSLNIMKQE